MSGGSNPNPNPNPSPSPNPNPNPNPNPDQVSLDGAPLVGGVEAGGYHVADYRPQPGWRLALSAHGGYPPGRKWVRGLTLLADAG